MERVLLAYDGSPKAREALFLATYLAGEWKLSLAVITVFEGDSTTPETLADAWQYLEGHGVEATYIKGTGPVVQEIVISADEQDCDLILMGGYGQQPPFGSELGSTVDQVLRAARKSVLICR
jgi:nucleotide-binding universal stress UspA family protein